MDTSKLKSFAPEVRRNLIEAVGRKLDYVLTADTPDLRAASTQVAKLRQQSSDPTERSKLIEQVSYTWFNRLAALRFLDARGWHPFHAKVLMPASPDETQPELLKQTRLGTIPDELKTHTNVNRLNDLLIGKLPSLDAQGEVYRHLLLASCRYYHNLMPFLFEKLDDETEFLLPDDVLTEHSIAHGFRTDITDEDCSEVEVLGWLYQFYISEKKQKVFDDLKKNIKINSENIPAATQLFTPHWIVRYLVENSLGRLWLLNRPDSQLAQKMEYYIKPEQPETDFLRINSPEEIKVCDPASGSGHMLTYAFDLLYAIYEEEGYDPATIPEKILTHNLYGIEIDERAGELAALALTLKAREKQRSVFSKGIEPNICVLENIRFDTIKAADLFNQSNESANELDAYMDFVGRNLFTTSLETTLRQFEEVKNFGSLIRPEI
ncbi:MAG: BREX-1 system adenine-specific DNA-methyltransferase PglX, partial [Fibrobacteres bacterium]|nr:BREX-1 system adenine-specific DNA-methyltransferase PglX [Fibrobacterota bacterium]